MTDFVTFGAIFHSYGFIWICRPRPTQYPDSAGY